jgi:hypothetical protein
MLKINISQSGSRIPSGDREVFTRVAAEKWAENKDAEN